MQKSKGLKGTVFCLGKSCNFVICGLLQMFEYIHNVHDDGLTVWKFVALSENGD